jgi:pyruvate,water dikinase
MGLVYLSWSALQWMLIEVCRILCGGLTSFLIFREYFMSNQQQQNSSMAEAYVLPFEQLRMTDVESVGGKNASLGEMISQLASTGVRVPTGFATTALAFRDFLKHNQLTERIQKRLENLNIDDVRALAQAGAEIRDWIETAPFQPKLEEDIRNAFAVLDYSGKGSFAVRSSATA